MKKRHQEKKQAKNTISFCCPVCKGTGADDMGYGFIWRCDRCHTWYRQQQENKMNCKSCGEKCLWFDNRNLYTKEEIFGFQCTMCGAIYNKDGDLIEEGYQD